MILTQCAACAAPLGLALGKKCSRCSTRYCGPACQAQHWKEGGHDKLCKKIRKAGGSEQYNANKKYTEAVAVAAEACAEDTKGQACYICTEAVHRHTKEGLVRGCACHTTEGFAHVSCLAEQAKILVAEAAENNLEIPPRWMRWNMCSLCEQEYHGVVSCALGWACWKTYLGRSETNDTRLSAMGQLGNGLSEANLNEDALPVKEAELSMLRRLGASEEYILVAQSNLAITYESLGRFVEAQSMFRDVHSGTSKLCGEEHERTLLVAYNYADSLVALQQWEEARSLLHKTTPVTRRVLGESHRLTLKMRMNYAETLYKDDNATLDDLREAVEMLEDAERTARRVFGSSYPLAAGIGRSLRDARAVLRAREVPSASGAV